MRKIWKNAAFNLIYTLTFMLFPLITSSYTSRVLFAEGVGRIASAQNLVSYFTMVVSLGMSSYGVKEIAKAQDDREQRSKTFSELFVFNFIFTSVAMVGYVSLIFSLSGPRAELPLYLACGAQLLFCFINIDWLYGGVEEFVYIACRSIAIKTLSVLALFLFVKDSHDYVICALITSLGLGLNYAFNVARARRYVSLTFRALDLRPHLTPLLVITLTTFLINIYGRLDVSMLTAMADESNVGYYSNGQKVVDMLVSVCTAVVTVLMPRMSATYLSDRREFQKVASLGFDSLIFVTIPLSAGLFVLAPQIVHLLFGQDFLPAAATVRVLSFLLAARGYSNLLTNMTISIGKEKKRLPAYVIAVAVNVLLNALLIPGWKQEGAAAASVISEALIVVSLFIALKNAVDFPQVLKSTGQALLCSGLMVLSMLPVLRIVDNILAQALAAFVVGSVVYCLSNLAIGNSIARSAASLILSKLAKGRS